MGDIVDANLETEIKGLYVCDASVIPIPWGCPPTFTVMSLGRRLGRHLAADYDVSLDQNGTLTPLGGERAVLGSTRSWSTPQPVDHTRSTTQLVERSRWRAQRRRAGTGQTGTATLRSSIDSSASLSRSTAAREATSLRERRTSLGRSNATTACSRPSSR